MSVAQDRPVEGYILSLSKDELTQDMLQPCGLISHRSWRLNLPVSTTFGSFFGGATLLRSGTLVRWRNPLGLGFGIAEWDRRAEALRHRYL